MDRPSWDDYFKEIVQVTAKRSSCSRLKVGCILVKDNRIIAQGYNGFPRGIQDTDLRYQDRELKYQYVVHAEMNCIYNAALNGSSLDGCTLYVWPLPVCRECCKGIIQSGIERVVSPDFTDPVKEERWRESCSQTMDMFQEVGIDYEFV